MAIFKVVIPARYGSLRLPGKPLREIAGRPMIHHVYASARQSDADEVVIATDNEQIKKVAQKVCATVCMTREDHASGTDRIAEVVGQLGWPGDAIVVNLQGDEPLMPPDLVSRVAKALVDHPDAVMATLATPLSDPKQLFDASVVKVVTDRHGYALYFSRAAIPWKRDQFDPTQPPTEDWLDGVQRHLGIYAYRAGFLADYGKLPVSPLERMESLEQLRVLWNGGKIAVERVDEAPPAGVDTAEDLARVDAILAGAKVGA